MGQTENILERLYKLTAEREAEPVIGSYTNYLLDKGQDRILSKIGEQSLGLLLASKNQNNESIKTEVADLLYHLTVLLYTHQIEWHTIAKELEDRRNENA